MLISTTRTKTLNKSQIDRIIQELEYKSRLNFIEQSVPVSDPLY